MVPHIAKLSETTLGDMLHKTRIKCGDHFLW